MYMREWSEGQLFRSCVSCVLCQGLVWSWWTNGINTNVLLLIQHMSGRVEWSMTRSTLQVLRKQRLLSLRQFPCASGKRELGQANCKPMWYCIEVFMYTAQSQCVISVRSGKLQAKWMPNWYCVPGRENCCKKIMANEKICCICNFLLLVQASWWFFGRTMQCSTKNRSKSINPQNRCLNPDHTCPIQTDYLLHVGV